MQHPFAGILNTDSSTHAEKITRRTALVAATAAAGVIISQGSLLGEDVAASEEEKPEVFGAYLVVPKDRRAFQTVAERLGVQGPYLKGFPNSEALKDKAGFLAWATPEIAKTIAADAGVEEIHPITAADKTVPTEIGKGETPFTVALIPNGWRTSPPAETFIRTEGLLEELNADEKMQELGASFTSSGRGSGNVMVVAITKDGDAAAVVKALAEHPQVMAVMPELRATTLALGEEGGGGAVTTQALGEEGGPRPSTRALGEEGGRPKITTFALGEEGGGGQLTTQALGEEGGDR